ARLAAESGKGARQRLRRYVEGARGAGLAHVARLAGRLTRLCHRRAGDDQRHRRRGEPCPLSARPRNAPHLGTRYPTPHRSSSFARGRAAVLPPAIAPAPWVMTNGSAGFFRKDAFFGSFQRPPTSTR